MNIISNKTFELLWRSGHCPLLTAFSYSFCFHYLCAFTAQCSLHTVNLPSSHSTMLIFRSFIERLLCILLHSLLSCIIIKYSIIYVQLTSCTHGKRQYKATQLYALTVYNEKIKIGWWTTSLVDHDHTLCDLIPFKSLASHSCYHNTSKSEDALNLSHILSPHRCKWNSNSNSFDFPALQHSISNNIT